MTTAAATTSTKTITSPATTTTQEVADPRAITRDIFSATLGSVCCCYTGQPFDTVKVRMQTNPLQFNGVLATTSSIFYNEGISAFWKGAIPTAIGMAFENAMAFGVNEALNRAFPSNNNDEYIGGGGGGVLTSLWKPFLMGGLTGCCSALVVLPSEIVKAKLQIVVGKNVTAQHIIQQMIIKQGYISSFMIGLDAQLARDISFYSVFFGGYQLFRYVFHTYIPSMPDEMNYFLSGGFAGMAGWIFAMPFDVPKTNVQASYETKVFGSYMPEFIRIAQQRGIGGFYNGLGPTLVRAFPANAALFLGVEMGKRCFDGYIWPQSQSY